MATRLLAELAFLLIPQGARTADATVDRRLEAALTFLLRWKALIPKKHPEIVVLSPAESTFRRGTFPHHADDPSGATCGRMLQ